MTKSGNVLIRNTIDSIKASLEDILILREYGNEMIPVRGSKICKSHPDELVVFQFLEFVHVNFGQVLFPLRSRGFWVVHSTKRVIISGEFVYFSIYCKQVTTSHACIPAFLKVA